MNTLIQEPWLKARTICDRKSFFSVFPPHAILLFVQDIYILVEMETFAKINIQCAVELLPLKDESNRMTARPDGIIWFFGSVLSTRW